MVRREDKTRAGAGDRRQHPRGKRGPPPEDHPEQPSDAPNPGQWPTPTIGRTPEQPTGWATWHSLVAPQLSAHEPVSSHSFNISVQNQPTTIWTTTGERTHAELDSEPWVMFSAFEAAESVPTELIIPRRIPGSREMV